MIERLGLFRASGDTDRAIPPARLGQPYAGGHIPAGFGLVGSGREAWDDVGFRAWPDDRLAPGMRAPWRLRPAPRSSRH
jgi:hypothetical protein